MCPLSACIHVPQNVAWQARPSNPLLILPSWCFSSPHPPPIFPHFCNPYIHILVAREARNSSFSVFSSSVDASLLLAMLRTRLWALMHFTKVKHLPWWLLLCLSLHHRPKTLGVALRVTCFLYFSQRSFTFYFKLSCFHKLFLCKCYYSLIIKKNSLKIRRN